MMAALTFLIILIGAGAGGAGGARPRIISNIANRGFSSFFCTRLFAASPEPRGNLTELSSASASARDAAASFLLC